MSDAGRETRADECGEVDLDVTHAGIAARAAQLFGRAAVTDVLAGFFEVAVTGHGATCDTRLLPSHGLVP